MSKKPTRERLPKWLERSELRQSVFPILPFRDIGPKGEGVISDPSSLGTAFFIEESGLFVTAKHVVEKYAHLDLLSVILYRRPRFIVCPVLAGSIKLHPEADMAVGFVELPVRREAYPVQVLRMNLEGLSQGSAVAMFGFPNTRVIGHGIEDAELALHLYPSGHVGNVTGYFPHGSTLTKGPTYTCTATTKNGISGGPVWSRREPGVRAIVSAGFTGQPHTNLTDIRCVLDLIDLPDAEAVPQVRMWRQDRMGISEAAR